MYLRWQCHGETFPGVQQCTNNDSAMGRLFQMFRNVPTMTAHWGDCSRCSEMSQRWQRIGEIAPDVQHCTNGDSSILVFRQQGTALIPTSPRPLAGNGWAVTRTVTNHAWRWPVIWDVWGWRGSSSWSCLIPPEGDLLDWAEFKLHVG